MTIIKIDGIRLEVQPPDIDGDGETGGIEKVQQQFNNETLIQQPTELGETLRHLNDDSIESNTRMSGIDMRANLHPFEVQPLLAMDALVALKVLPTSCLAFSRQKKRLSVSINGRGRDDVVKIAGGQREHQEMAGGGGFVDKIKGLTGMNK